MNTAPKALQVSERPGLIFRVHQCAALIPLLFFAIGLSLAVKFGFTPKVETYPRVRYQPSLSAQSILGMWAGNFQKRKLPEQRLVAVLGLADEGKSLSENSQGLSLARELARAGARVRVFDPRFGKEDAGQWIPQVEFSKDMLSACLGATDLVVNSDLAMFQAPDWGELKSAMKGKLFFDCVSLADAEIVRSVGFAHFPIGGHGWPPWLDQDYQAFVQDLVLQTKPTDRILLLPSGPLTTLSPRARWYLLLNYAIAPRKLLIAGPSNASGTAPQYQDWVRERNRQGKLQGMVLDSVLAETQADWILWFKQSDDFKPSDWRLEAVQ